jgi:hypothetical protein
MQKMPTAPCKGIPGVKNAPPESTTGGVIF